MKIETIKEIGRNEKLLSILSENNSILDAKVKRIAIFEEEEILKAELVLKMRPSSEFDNILICFINVLEYNFYYNHNHIFYYVERYKFFCDSEDRFYISLDPIDEVEEISEDDQDFILSKEVVGYSR